MQYKLTDKDKAILKSKPQEPVVSHNAGKISPTLMQERLVLCSHEPDLNRRLAMYERLATQVQLASIPYIKLLMEKTKNKIVVNFEE